MVFTGVSDNGGWTLFSKSNSKITRQALGNAARTPPRHVSESHQSICTQMIRPCTTMIRLGQQMSRLDPEWNREFKLEPKPAEKMSDSTPNYIYSLSVTDLDLDTIFLVNLIRLDVGPTHIIIGLLTRY